MIFWKALNLRVAQAATRAVKPRVARAEYLGIVHIQERFGQRLVIAWRVKRLATYSYQPTIRPVHDWDFDFVFVVEHCLQTVGVFEA